jgi:hypothetical protein
MSRRVKKREKSNKLPWSSCTFLTSLWYFLYEKKNFGAKERIHDN